MTCNYLIPVLLIIPLIAASFSLLKFSDRVLFHLTSVFCGIEMILSLIQLRIVYIHGEQFFAGKLFFIDMLSSFQMTIVSIVFFAASVYGTGYFANDTAALKHSRRYSALWNIFLFTMVLVLSSNNMGMLWVAIEATTLASAFLIMTYGEPSSIEAMWKYLLICSVGIAFGLIGTLLLSAASRVTGTTEPSLLWTDLRTTASMFDKGIMLAAFIFVLIGFGTKAGLAPMHTWLPDAHSQAPTPVSAVFSAVMLNSAFYCVLRYLPLTESALGETGQTRGLLLFFGLLSICTAMVFIPAQKDIKRFLAYSSIEHIGIIVVGIGLGGIGVIAALLHTVNHSFAKMLSFFSAGKISHTFGTKDMGRIQGALKTNRYWGTGFFAGTLALIGTAPFAIFTSELQIFRAGFNSGRYGILALLLIGTVTIFIAALKHIMGVSLGKPGSVEKHKPQLVEKLLVVSCILIALIPGLFVPGFLWNILTKAAAIIGK
jgi:hydrogenase-4 component F